MNNIVFVLHRDTIAQLEKEEEWRGRNKARAGEKQKKQLAELEAQLVLASPHLLFQEVWIPTYKVGVQLLA